MEMKKFDSFDEYVEWTEQFDSCSDYETIPVAIDDGKKISMDIFTECKSFKTAIRRFEKAFSEFKAEMDGWIDCMKESCENGYFKDSYCEDSVNNYSWGVEETMDGYWYVFLNISGIHAGR